MAEQFVKVDNFRQQGEFAVAAGQKIVNREAILFRRSACDLRFTRGKQRNPLFLYFDVTAKKVVETNAAGRDILSPSNMTNIESFKLDKTAFNADRARKECEDIQIKQGAVEGNFVLSSAKERQARYNGVTQKFFDLFHDGNYVGTTNELGYDIARGVA